MNIFRAGDKVVRTGSSGGFITRGQECIVEKAKGRVITLRGIWDTYGRHVVYLAHEFELAPTLTPRKHQKEIIAWANGATIQYWSSSDEVWYDTLNNKPLWKDNLRYRVKPDNTAEVEAEIAELEDMITELKKDL
jgi:hypothetical protein